MSPKILSVIGAIGIMAIGSYGAFQLSPWPMALVQRLKLDRGGAAMAAALEQYVPSGVAARVQQRYADDSAAYLDVFYPAAVENTEQALPTVVWVHGGSWVSGSSDHVANYLRILAAKGFTTVGVDYALAPGETYPTPVVLHCGIYDAALARFSIFHGRQVAIAGSIWFDQLLQSEWILSRWKP